MRFKLTILLVVLNITLFGLIFYVDRVQSTRRSFESASRLILDPTFVQGLDRLRLAGADGTAVWEFQRGADGGWMSTAPIQWKANPYAIQRLLFLLRDLSWEARFPVGDLAAAGQSLESYGLASVPLRLELASGTEVSTIGLGAPTEIGNRLYTMSPDGQHVLVIGRGLLQMLQQDVTAFLDRRIFGIGVQECRVVQVQDRSASNVRVRLERGESGWRLVSPIEAAADSERVQAMIAEWQSLEAENLEGASASGLEMDGNSLRLTFEGLNRRETLIVAPDPAGPEAAQWYLARREDFGAVFRIPAKRIEALRRVQEDLREKRVLLRLADDWTSLKVDFGGLSTTLQQLESGAWQVLYRDRDGELKSLPADPDALQGLKDLMRTMEAVRFVSDAPSETDLSRFGLLDPQRRLTLRMASGEQVEFRIGGISAEDDKTLLYASTSLSASVFLVRPHVLGAIPLSPLHYRQRTLLEVADPARLGDIALVRRADGKNLLEPATGQPDPAIAAAGEQVRRFICLLRVERFISTPFADPLALDETRSVDWPYELVASLANPESPDAPAARISYLLSTRLGGATQYLGDPATGLVGILPPTLIEALDPLLAMFPEDPGNPPAAEPQPQSPQP